MPRSWCFLVSATIAAMDPEGFLNMARRLSIEGEPTMLQLQAISQKKKKTGNQAMVWD